MGFDNKRQVFVVMVALDGVSYCARDLNPCGTLVSITNTSTVYKILLLIYKSIPLD